MKLILQYDCAHCGKYHETRMDLTVGHDAFVNMRGRPDYALCDSCRFKQINAYRAAKGMDLLPLDDFNMRAGNVDKEMLLFAEHGRERGWCINQAEDGTWAVFVMPKQVPFSTVRYAPNLEPVGVGPTYTMAIQDALRAVGVIP